MLKLFSRVCLLLVLFVVGAGISKADPTYFTRGCFGAACVPGVLAVLPIGAGSLVYTGQLSLGLNVPPGGFSAAELGDFRFLGAPAAVLGPTPFTLEIVQLLPAPGSSSFSVLISGIVAPGLSTFNVVFSSTQVTIGGFRYTLTNLGGPGTIDPFALIINPPGQVTTVQGIVEPVPEPATMLLLGSGLVGSVLFLRRRRAAAAGVKIRAGF